jgi:hypothetical protein
MQRQVFVIQLSQNGTFFKILFKMVPPCKVESRLRAWRKTKTLKKTVKDEALIKIVSLYLSHLDALVQKNNGFFALGRARTFQNLDKGLES